MAQNITVISVVRVVTTKLFRNHRPRMPLLNTPRKLASVNLEGNRPLELCCSTSLGVRAIDSIHRMGTNQVNAATIISTWYRTEPRRDLRVGAFLAGRPVPPAADAALVAGVRRSDEELIMHPGR